jgi:hypothetical protein
MMKTFTINDLNRLNHDNGILYYMSMQQSDIPKNHAILSVILVKLFKIIDYVTPIFEGGLGSN